MGCVRFYHLDEDAPPSPTPDVPTQPSDSSQPKKKPVSLSYEEYKRMTNLILYHMKSEEEIADLGKLAMEHTQIG